MRRFNLTIMVIASLMVLSQASLLAQTEWVKVDSLNPVLTMGAAGQWDDRFLTESCIIYDEAAGEYKMWYTAKHYAASPMRIGLATSPDLFTWNKDTANNPVLEPGLAGSHDQAHALDPTVIYEDGIYKMWYTGKSSSGIWSCLYAESDSGFVWTSQDSINPVLESGEASEWDDYFVGYNTVVKVDSTYYMYYAGASSSVADNEIGLATSTDGINFTRYSGNPILRPGHTWDVIIYPEAVVYDGQLFHLWYGGEGGTELAGVGYAWSEDGMNWHKYPNPVLEAGEAGAWDALAVWPGAVIMEDSTYHMIYETGNFNTWQEFGYAYSVAQNMLPIADAGTDMTFTADSSTQIISVPLDGSASVDYDGSIVSWDWAWEGGNAEGLTVDAEFAVGSHTVTLTVTDDDGETGTDEMVITVDPWVGVDPEITPASFAIHQNYPNPFNPTTTLRYDLPETSDVSLIIYDINGQEVFVLNSRHQPSGAYAVTWNGENQRGQTASTGVYFACLSAGTFSKTIKMVYMK
ncbi:MAG: T9SS type A sorting domain-containing protein [Candidatus Marinimicrobia bacterium]|nr:T9SS type A sorting domain-containing protein [Candidatus Neomarinimicrobiota bacterium]MBT4296820.1 T9SS type A sorting domain-containing protein [Candidatus Neomarinimicrobiota bacterium]MBT4419528.1 T9SS type A sorting domain-containing protein [Candidatus Neomarinimicrobiota bacterium]MBT4992319.1 T9SS type A sorting domain-containing protein [Candidatus Neomarinimicrobiota bacterium]MBT5312727.1 T9SS type A sorting domain-containing protein [Candidatus Neomarinimicrobiota bacterium]